MISAGTISEIVGVYEKHGWLLRRVLLSSRLKAELAAAGEDIFRDVGIADSDIDAAWFSRPPSDGGVPWEIRHLSDSPYSLLENIDENDAGFEDALKAVEDRLRKNLGSR